ncbi:unnamed protein product [Microthlaspi erraticum]|uniref:Uncharacterized protein n=1 Tax=Microthlaspi erraticum TaxID=1685480 RepID=A0A6D2KDZ2_9BRAS|nr:unnamed protein product [Microthlaspi erraticum]
MSSSPVETVMPDCPVDPECIGVFWDVVDFPFPKGLSPDMIYDKTKLFLESLGCCGELSIIAYANEGQFDDKLVGVYEDAKIIIVPRLADKLSRYRSTCVDIAMWEVDTCNYDFHAKNLMVLSKEIEKDSFLFKFLDSMACPCHHVFLTLDHDPPPSRVRRLERISFSLPLEPVDQSGNLLGSSRETMPDCLIAPDSPVESSSYEPCAAHVFWDGVDFPLPYNDPHYAYMVSHSSLNEFGAPGELSLAAYVDHADFCGETETDGITVIPCQGDEEARSHGMLMDIVLWAMENPATYFEPITLMVISKNIKQGTCFLNALEALGNRHYNVLLGLPSPQDVSSPMAIKSLNCGSDIFIFWDVLGCPTDFSTVDQVLRTKSYRGNVIVRPYVDAEYRDDSFDTTPNRFRFKSSIRVVSEEDDKYEKVTRMLLDIIF